MIKLFVNLCMLYLLLRFFIGTILSQSISYTLIKNLSKGIESKTLHSSNNMQTRLTKMSAWGLIQWNEDKVGISKNILKYVFALRIIQILFHGKQSKISRMIKEIELEHD